MGAGMNYHLSVNSMLREIFELGAPLNILDADGSNKLSKTQRVRVHVSLKFILLSDYFVLNGQNLTLLLSYRYKFQFIIFS